MLNLRYKSSINIRRLRHFSQIMEINEIAFHKDFTLIFWEIGIQTVTMKNSHKSHDLHKINENVSLRLSDDCAFPLTSVDRVLRYVSEID